jgi:transglutaminase-like putative cysteine protease
MRKAAVPVLVCLCAAAGSSLRADDLPPWLREAANHKTPSYTQDVPAAVLLNEERIAVEDNGRVLTTIRKAVRILTRAGRKQAFVMQTYFTGNGRIRDSRGWVLSPNGSVFKVGKDETVDLPMITSNTYEDLRVRILDGQNKVDPGAVFGYEVVSESNFPFAQFSAYFQGPLPVLDSIYALTLPQGWQPHAILYNHDPVEPAVNGNTYTWSLHNLPYVPEEPASPALDSLVPRISVTCLPSAGARPIPVRSFANWQEVSRWVTEISDAQAEPDAAVTAKSKALTANATSVYGRIQAIAAWVQALRYVAIQTGLERGNGYRPHPAGETFTKEYGDCKDKATLMRALLKAAGIDSYLVTISANDRSYVREDFPSPEQFNHAIVAVAIPPEVRAPTVIDHAQLGRLLFFDPTSDVTSLGDLPINEQGSLAMIAAGEKGGLVRMPMMPPSSNLIRREVEATLDEAGNLTAHLHEVTSGQAAAASRNDFYSHAHGDYLDLLQRWIARGANGAVTSRIEPHDSLADGTLSLDIDFSAPAYGQKKGSTLLVFRPVVVNRRSDMFLVNPERVCSILPPGRKRPVLKSRLAIESTKRRTR